MATRIGVIPAGHQTDRPTHHILKAEAEQRVFAGAAEWFNAVTIKMRSVYEKCAAKTKQLLDLRRMRMPSHKAPGTKTHGPVVEQDGFGRARIVLANMIAAGR